jgi:hypothetical protein
MTAPPGAVFFIRIQGRTTTTFRLAIRTSHRAGYHSRLRLLSKMAEMMEVAAECRGELLGFVEKTGPSAVLERIINADH